MYMIFSVYTIGRYGKRLLPAVPVHHTGSWGLRTEDNGARRRLRLRFAFAYADEDDRRDKRVQPLTITIAGKGILSTGKAKRYLLKERGKLLSGSCIERKNTRPLAYRQCIERRDSCGIEIDKKTCNSQAAWSLPTH